MAWVAHLGVLVSRWLGGFGDFCRFCGMTFGWIIPAVSRRRNLQAVLQEFYEIGTRSIPVVMITGAFVGAVLAVRMTPRMLTEIETYAKADQQTTSGWLRLVAERALRRRRKPR